MLEGSVDHKMAKRLPSTPPILPGFTYVRPLGAGGFADVFLYEQQMPRRQVAIKVLLRDLVDDQVARMFNAEADVMARLGSHPAIVTVYEANISADGRPYIAMEYCPVTIAHRYRAETMSVSEVLHIGVAMAGAVESAHRAGVLHRDIKPSNLMLTSFGAPALADFGIASSLSGSAGVMALSVPWSAPEVISDQSTGTVASEVWSLGATVYSLLAGHSPFEIPGSGRNGAEELSARILKARYTPLTRVDFPPDLQTVLAQGMHAQPGARQVSAEHFGEHLQRIEQQMGLPVTPMNVARGDSAFAAPEVNFSDADLRGGAVRSHVDVPSTRRPRTVPVPVRPDDIDEQAAPRAPRGVPLNVAIWSAAGFCTVIAALVVWIILRSGS